MFNGKVQDVFEKVIDSIQPLDLTSHNSVYVFPFDLIAGFITNTELGNNDNVKIEDYSTFQRIFTGRENLLATWSNSTEILNNNGEDPEQYNEYYYERNRGVGDYYRAYVLEKDGKAIFTPSPKDKTFLQQSDKEYISLIIYKELTRKDLFKLYIVPQFTEGENDPQWYYVSNRTTYIKANGDFFSTKLELTSLNTELAETGQTIEQFVQRGEPGAGYAWPSISLEADKKVSVDIKRIQNVGATSIQSAFNGTGCWGSVLAYGRPLSQPIFNVQTQKFEDKVYANRQLYGYVMQTPLPSPIFTRQGAESDYFFSQVATPQLENTYADWAKQRQAQVNPALLNAYEGLLNLNELVATLQETNVSTNVANDMAPTYSFWNNDWKQDIFSWKIIKEVETGGTGSPEKGNIELDATKDAVYGLGGSSIAGEVELDPNDPTLMIKTDFIRIRKQTSKTHTTTDIFALNSHILKKYTTLPISIRHNTIWTLRDFPFIGGILSKATGGIYIGWKDSNVHFQSEPIMLFVPTTMAIYGQSTMADDSEKLAVRIPLELFSGKSDFASAEYGGIPAINIMAKIGLTDRIAEPYWGDDPTYQGSTFFYVYNTIHFGQIITTRDIYNSNDWDVRIETELVKGAPAGVRDPFSVRKRVFFNGESKPIPPLKNKDKFIIDGLENYVLSKVDQQWSIFNGDVEIFQTTQKSFSQFTKSIRDWNNLLKTSHIKPTNQPPMRYPSDLIPPTNPLIPKEILILNAWQGLGFSAQTKKDPILQSTHQSLSDRNCPIWDLFTTQVNARVYIAAFSGKPHLNQNNWDDPLNPISLKSVIPNLTQAIQLPNNWVNDYDNITIETSDNQSLSFAVSTLASGTAIKKSIDIEVKQPQTNKVGKPALFTGAGAFQKWDAGTSGEEYKLANEFKSFSLSYSMQKTDTNTITLTIEYKFSEIVWTATGDKEYTFRVRMIGGHTSIDYYDLDYTISVPQTPTIISAKLFPN